MEELKENLFNWYNFKENAEILVLGDNIFKYINQKVDKSITPSKKYDYVILVGMLEKSSRMDILRKAISVLKDDGKLLIAENNKFGINNWNGKRDLEGSLDYRELTRTYNENEDGLLAKHQISELLSNLGVSNHKFYYVFPNYSLPNLIYTDDYTLTEEDITRNFEAYEDGEFVNFNENLALTEIVKENPKLVSFFANSFLIEASKSEIESDIKYISFTNYRKKEYRIATILKENVAEKKATTTISEIHIKNIAENLKNFPTENTEALETLNNNVLESKFIKDTPRLDLYMKNLKTYEEFIKEFNEYKKVLYQNTLEYLEVKDDLCETLKAYGEEKLSKMKFLKYAFIDMLPKNCFKIDGKYCFFDQEWCENYYPVEYIVYRAINNTEGIVKKYGEEKLFKDLGIYEFLDLFKNLEEEFRKKVIDDSMLYDLFDKKVVTREALLVDYNKKIVDRDTEINRLNIDVEAKRAHVEELLGVVNEKESQITAMLNSRSWKITKPLRDVSEKIHERKNKKMLKK